MRISDWSSDVCSSDLDDHLARLATLSPAELRGEWLQLFRTPAPAVGPWLLALAIAHRLQEKALGALAVEHARELARLAKRYGATGEIDTDDTATLKAGTRLVRDWHGKPHQVLIRGDGLLVQAWAKRSQNGRRPRRDRGGIYL